jgi:hypothetical protein
MDAKEMLLQEKHIVGIIENTFGAISIIEFIPVIQIDIHGKLSPGYGNNIAKANFTQTTMLYQ